MMEFDEYLAALFILAIFIYMFGFFLADLLFKDDE